MNVVHHHRCLEYILDPFHNIFHFKRLNEWFWLLCYVSKEEHFLACLRYTGTLNGQRKCQKRKAILSSCRLHLMVKHFCPVRGGIFPGCNCPSGRNWSLEGWMKMKTMWITLYGWCCHHFLAEFSIQLGNGNSMFHTYKQNYWKTGLSLEALVSIHLWNL